MCVEAVVEKDLDNRNIAEVDSLEERFGYGCWS
jgi:hypothetical protein